MTQPPVTTLDIGFICELAFHNDSVPYHISLTACSLYDSLLHRLDMGQDKGFLRIPSLEDVCDWQRVTNYKTICCLDSRIVNVATCAQISTVRPDIEYIFSKIVPQKCMTRTFARVCFKRFRKSGPFLLLKLRQLVLCSWLGNFPHVSPQHRASPCVRPILYQLLNNEAEERYLELFKRIFVRCDYVVEFALRDYFIFAVHDNPSLFQHFKNLCEWEPFEAVVQETMNKMRAYFSFSKGFRNNPLVAAMACSTEELDDSDALDALVDDLNNVCDLGHERLLTVCYKRMNSSILGHLVATRKARPLIPLPQNPKVILDNYNDDNEDDDDDDEEDDDDDDVDILDPVKQMKKKRLRKQQRKEEKAAKKQRKNKKDEDTEDDDEDETDTNSSSTTSNKSMVSDVRPFITEKQYTVLRDIVQRLAPLRTGLLMKCTTFFQYFGIPETSLTLLRAILHHFQQGGLDRPQRLYCMTVLGYTDRHAFNLLHITVDIIKELTSVQIVKSLPYHILENQIDAIRSRYNVENTNAIPEHALYFRFCNVCDTVYSLVRDFRSVYKNEYEWGYRNCATDYETFEIYCTKNKINQRGACEAKPLLKVPLLGNLLAFNGKYIMLCPQKYCGMPMVVNTRDSFYNSRGPACCDCTAKLSAKASTLVASIQHDTKCVWCTTPMAKTNNAFLMPHGVIVCKKHLYKGLIQHIQTENPSNHQQTVQLIVDFVRARRDAKEESKKALYKRELVLSKLKARENVRR